jgi:ABC-type amino acid transport system permease subunit
MLITDDSRLLMQEATRMTKEVGELIFDLVYLAVIWTIVFKMYGTLHRLPEERLPLARTLALAFALLALGDTGHVGFRVVAHLAGGVEANPQLLGVGKLATAITVTVFYALLVRAWKLRYNKRYGILAYLLFISAAVRLSFMLLPGNQWARDIAPFDFSMHRNIPLLIQGLGVAYLILTESVKSKDSAFTWIGLMILVSYAFYTPVILYARAVPALGLLMIPKTMAYMVAAFVAYRSVFRDSLPVG